MLGAPSSEGACSVADHRSTPLSKTLHSVHLPRIVDKSRASSMAGGSSTQSSLIFGFLVAFLGIFALGVTGGIAWPHIRRTVALRFGIFQAPEDSDSTQIHQQLIPELWDVCVRAVMRNARVSECAWEHLRASTPLPLLRL